MRKSFKHILLAGLTIASTAMAMNAQTLTQDWKVTEGLPTAGNARWGIGFDGKVYTNDKSVPQIIAINAEGKTTVATSAAGTAITVDGAGNFIVNDGFPNAASSTTFKILPAGTTEMIDLAVTLPEGVKADRLDFLGRAVGNVMSETGGAFYITPANSGKIAKIFVAKGVQVAEKSKAIVAGIACASDGHVQPADNNPETDNIFVRPARTQAFFDGLTKVGTANTTAGGDAVTLDGTLFTFEPCGTNYVDGFQVVNRTTNEVVATHENEFSKSAAAPNQNAISVEKVDEYTAAIYQYVPGQMAAKYTFSLPKPKMYILGQNEVGDAWNPTSGIAMTWESGNVWSATVTTAPGRENLGFVSVLAENNDEGGWTYVNGNRWGLENDKQEGALAEKLTVSKNSNSINVGVGTFFIRMNLDDNTLYIAPTKLYVIGTSNKAEGHLWAPNDDSYMAESDPETPGVFTFDPIDLKVENKAVGEEAEEDLAYFAFVTGIDAEWGPVNNSRWCPNNKDGELTDNTDFTDFGKHYNGAFCIKNGAYKLTVDLNTKTVKAVYLTSSGVEQVGAEAAGVIAADGRIRIVGDAATVSVYNAAGQAVAINSAERTFAVARGMYVVVVDGKATKVIVR